VEDQVWQAVDIYSSSTRLRGAPIEFDFEVKVGLDAAAGHN
jgi:hypothetical protein